MFVVFIGLVFICTASCGINYSKLSEAGVVSRIDLINCLKLALNLSQPSPMPTERAAALEFVKFLNTSRSDEYLEAFYANNKVDNVNRFQQFLNGILYNGNPLQPIWKSAETLTKMIKTKSNPDELENKREVPKNFVQHNNATNSLGKKAKMESRKQIDYVEIYNKPDLTPLEIMMTSVVKNLN